MNDLETLMRIAEIMANLNIVEGYGVDDADLENIWKAVSLARDIIDV